MSIVLAKTAGFCYGVRRAVKMALDVSQRANETIYTLGPLIHNPQTLDVLRSRGVIRLDAPDALEKGTVLIRAHGVTPHVRADLYGRSLDICDATCPHVLRAQQLLTKSVEKGMTPIIVGDKGHAEVLGLVGCSDGKGIVVEKEDDIPNLGEGTAVCVVAQTTQARNRYDRICTRIKEMYPDARIYDTICDATSRRQKEALEIAEKVDAMIVVGGKQSANTLRLAELCAATGTPTLHVETADELPFKEIFRYRTLGVTAGASTPHWIIRNVLEHLDRLDRLKKHPVVRLLYTLVYSIVYFQILLGLGAALLTYSISLLMNLTPKLMNSALAFCYVLSMHILNKYVSLPKDRSLLYGALKFIAERGTLCVTLGVGGILASILIASTINLTVLMLLIISVFFGLFYSFAIIPRTRFPRIRYRRLMDIPGSKDIFTAFAWSVVAVLVPALEAGITDYPSVIAAFVSVALLVLVRAILFDIRDLEGDIVVGRETVAVIFGGKATAQVLQTTLLLVGLILLLGGLLQFFSSLAFVLIIVMIYSGMSFLFTKQQELYQSIVYDLYVDSQFLLAGLLAYGWQMVI